VFGHQGTLKTGTLKSGDKVEARVNVALRESTMRNHSVTHLMHKALREVLGSHVQQKGSLVDQDKTRFDFAHDKPMSDAEIHRVEALVNAEILQNVPTRAQVMPIEEAKRSGAMMALRREVRRRGAGPQHRLVARILRRHARRAHRRHRLLQDRRAVRRGGRRAPRRGKTGEGAVAWVQAVEAEKHFVEGFYQASGEALRKKLLADREERKNLEKELSRLKARLAMGQGQDLASQAVDVKGAKVLAATLQDADVKTLRETMDKLKDRLKSAAIVLGAVNDGKVSLIAGVTADLIGKVKAGELVNYVAEQVGGKGGGRPDMAQAGGSEAAKLPGALDSVRNWVEQRL